MSVGEQSPAPAGSITIDQLLALNQEIVALVRAKVPLERGLAVAVRDLKGKLKTIAGGLSRRLKAGESLADALAGEGKAIPPLYRAVVEAGARSGKLAVALEGLERYVRGYSEARAAVGLALWYPLLVFTLAYALFVGLVSVAIPRFVDAFQSLGLKIATPLHWLAWIGESAHYWWPIGPALLVIVAIGWLRSGTAAQFQARSWTWLKIFPWMRALWRITKRRISPTCSRCCSSTTCLIDKRSSWPQRQPATSAWQRALGPSPKRSHAAIRRRLRSQALTDTRFSPCCAGCWRRARSKGRWFRLYTTLVSFIASAASMKRKSSPCSCRWF